MHVEEKSCRSLLVQLFLSHFKRRQLNNTESWGISLTNSTFTDLELSINHIFKGPFINHVDMAGGGGLPNVHVTT